LRSSRTRRRSKIRWPAPPGTKRTWRTAKGWSWAPRFLCRCRPWASLRMCPCAAKRQPRWRPSVGTGDPAGHSGAACTGARTMRHRYAKEACQLARVDELPAYAHARPARKVRRYHDAPLAAPARLLRRPAPPSLATLHGRTQVSKGCRVTGIQGIRTGRFASADSRASCGHGERRPRIRPSGRAGRLPCRS
jgi:hypothetical protein